MRSFVLCTVQHTGTISLRSLFLDMGYQRLRGIERFMVDQSDNERWIFNHKYATGKVFNWHPYAYGTRHLRRLDAPIVTTQRNMEDVKESWVRRYGTLTHSVTNRMSLDSQVSMWRKHVLPNADVVVPIEDPAEALAKLETLLDVELPRELPHLNKGGHGTIVERIQ